MFKPLYARPGHVTSLSAAKPGTTCGGSAPLPFSSHSIAAGQQAAVDSAGGCSSLWPARAPVSVQVMHALHQINRRMP
jgi:hypothetical protein